MKKLSILLLAGTLLAGTVTSAAELKISVNGVTLKDANPYVDNGVTMLPLRIIGEALDCEIKYENYKGYPKISIGKGDQLIMLGPDFMVHLVDGEVITGKLSKELISKDNTTYVALRDVAEALNITVDFNQSQNTITISEDSTPSKPVTNRAYNDLLTQIEEITGLPCEILDSSNSKIIKIMLDKIITDEYQQQKMIDNIKIVADLATDYFDITLNDFNHYIRVEYSYLTKEHIENDKYCNHYKYMNYAEWISYSADKEITWY